MSRHADWRIRGTWILTLAGLHFASKTTGFYKMLRSQIRIGELGCETKSQIHYIQTGLLHHAVFLHSLHPQSGSCSTCTPSRVKIHHELPIRLRNNLNIPRHLKRVVELPRRLRLSVLNIPNLRVYTDLDPGAALRTGFHIA